MMKIVARVLTALAVLGLAASAGAAPFAYITSWNEAKVYIIDLSTNSVTSIGVGNSPWGVAVDAAGSKVYVSNYADSTVSVIDAATNSIVRTISLGTNTFPRGVAVSPSGARVYVANQYGAVSVIDAASGTLAANITVGSTPRGIAVNPSGTRVYAANNGGNSVSAIDTSTNAVVATITGFNAPYGVAINPSGTALYVANFGSAGNGNAVSIFDLSTNKITRNITVGAGPTGIAVSPDGARIYVANYTGSTVSVIDSSTGSVTATISVGTNPMGVSVSSDGTRVYAASNSGSISVIDAATNTVKDTITRSGWMPQAFGQFIYDPAPLTSIITAPTNGAEIKGAAYLITGNAAGSGLQKVEVSTDGGTTWSAAAGTASWNYSWPLPADGSYTIKSRATDGAGNVETPGAGITVVVDNTPPVVSAGQDRAAGAAFTQTASAADANAMTYAWSTVAGPGIVTFGSPAALSTTISADIDGTYKIRFTAADAAGNSSSSDLNLTWDTAAPASAVVSPSRPYVSGAPINISGTASDSGSGIRMVEVSTDGGKTWTSATDASGNGSWAAWSYSWTSPVDGSYTIKIRATDNAGNVEAPSAGVAVKVDNTPPAVGAGSDRTAGAEFTQTASAADANAMTYSWSKVSGPGALVFGSPDALSTSISADTDGQYVVRFTAADAAGNSASADMSLEWDTAAPSSTVTAPAEGAMLDDAPYNVTGTAADAGSGVQTVEVSTDGGSTWNPATGTMDWSFLWTPDEGIHTIKIRATDKAGNIETPGAGITVLVDGAAPVSSISSPATGATINGASAVISGSATDGNGSGVLKVDVSTDGGATWNEVSEAADWTSWSYEWALPADGSYILRARATDKAGHTETPGAGVSVTVDNSSPVITKPSVGETRPAQYSPNLPEFAWTANRCVRFKVWFSGTPDFKKVLKAVSDNKGAGATYNPLAASWNRITALGRRVYLKVEGWTSDGQDLKSQARELALDGGFSDLSDIPVTDVAAIPTMGCDPGASQSVLMEFSAEPYFMKPVKTPALTPGSAITYTPDAASWSKITKLGPVIFWRFMGRLSTGETTYSETKSTVVAGGPVISDPADGSTVGYPLTISWSPAGFVSFAVQASAAENFSGKPVVLGTSKTGSLTLSAAAWKKLTALGSPAYVRVAATTAEKYTAYGPALKVYTVQ